MPAIVSGTVVRWKIVEPANQPRYVVYDKSALISIYVPDGSHDTVASAIIAKYIRDQDAGAREQLLDNARDGLLEVVDINRIEITPPPPPPPA